MSQDLRVPPATAHPKIVRLYEYWREKAPLPGMLPGRRHIDPTEIATLLDNIWLLDVVGEPGRFRYRLIGDAMYRKGIPGRPGEFVDQFFRGRRIDAAGTCETAQCLASRPNLQLADPAAPDQLLGLGEEFDLPDTAPTGFDIVAFDRDSPAAAMRIDLTLDRVDVLDRREVEVFSPDEGSQFAQKALRGNAIAGDRARLDQGGAFPILPDAFVVGERRRDRYGERRGCRIGAKPKIGAEHIPITGAFLQNAHQIARQADKEGLHAVARGHRSRLPGARRSGTSGAWQ